MGHWSSGSGRPFLRREVEGSSPSCPALLAWSSRRRDRGRFANRPYSGAEVRVRSAPPRLRCYIAWHHGGDGIRAGPRPWSPQGRESSTLSGATSFRPGCGPRRSRSSLSFVDLWRNSVYARLSKSVSFSGVRVRSRGVHSHHWWGRSSAVERCFVRADVDGSIPFVPARVSWRKW